MTDTQNRNWGFPGRGNSHTLEGVVRQLNPKAKQGMYAAANKGLIMRGTWNGCAFNKAGVEALIEMGQVKEDQVTGGTGRNYVTNISKAASVFGLSSQIVSDFISVWDSIPGTDEEATERLKEAILAAGLFAEPNESSGRRLLRETIYKSYESKMKEEFHSLVDGLDVAIAENTATDKELELMASITGASELLSASC